MTPNWWCRLFHRKHREVLTQDIYGNCYYEWVWCEKCGPRLDTWPC